MSCLRCASLSRLIFVAILSGNTEDTVYAGDACLTEDGKLIEVSNGENKSNNAACRVLVSPNHGSTCLTDPNRTVVSSRRHRRSIM